MTRFLFWATVLSLLFTPSIPISDGLPAIRIDDITAFTWLFLALATAGVLRVTPPGKYRLACLAGIVIILPFSFGAGYLAGLPASGADMIQLVRVFKYLAVYLMAAAYFAMYPVDSALARVSTLTLPLLGLALIQYFDVGALNVHYVPYIAPTQFEALMPGYPTPRPVGMVGNPNELGFMFTMLGLVALYLSLRFRKMTNLIALACAVLGVLITLSRGSAVSLVGGGLVAAAMHFIFLAKGRERVAFLLMSGLGLAATVLVLLSPPIYDAVTWRFVRILDPQNDTSWMARLSNWSENWAMFMQSPIVGVGPLRRAVLEHAADNDWLLIARSYGLIGVAAVMGAFAAKVSRERAPLAASLAMAGTLYMIVTSLFHSLTLFPIFLILLAATDAKPNHAKAARPRLSLPPNETAHPALP